MIRKSIVLAFLLYTVAIFISPSGLFGQTLTPARIWKGNSKDDGSVHALGNGKMLVYEFGSKIFWVGPSPYSTPSLLNLDLIENSKVESTSSRETGTAIWTHEFYKNGKSLGTMVDFVDSTLPCMVRQFNLTESLSFRLKLLDEVIVVTKSEVNDSKGTYGKLQLLVPKGALFFEKYAYPGNIYHQIAWEGKVKVEPSKEEKNLYILNFEPGVSKLYFVGGPEYPQTINNWEEIRNLTYDKLIARTRKWWRNFTSERFDFGHQLPSGLPLREKLLQTIDDVSVMIKTQQSQEGAVMAGYRYPMGYVRDQYGVSRGLLALGYTREAKHILEFYWNIWQKFGEIHDAQAIGVPGVFHVFENDEVEITGYIILQAFDLLEKSDDDEFVKRIFPMLEWCWEAQKKNLVRGMLPFNGDETYVAGGFLPTTALNDGSVEATLLFIEGGEKFLKWINKHKNWPSEKIEHERVVLQETRYLFRENFWRNGQLTTNNPERVNLAKLPRFRPGPCERRGPDCLVINNKGYRSGAFWNELDQNNRYQCPACFALGPLPKVEPALYNLISSNLVPLYIHSDLIKADELKPMVENVFNQYEKTGILSCIIDSIGTNKNKGTVGYDYGLLLYSMLETKTRDAEKLYRQTLAVADSAGVWSEYYMNNTPYLTRYRPWESAINIEALIKFANQYHK